MSFNPELWNMESFWEDYLRPIPDLPSASEPPSDEQPPYSETIKARDDEAERIAFLFHQQTCHALSIQTESDLNPWSTLIWPLAKTHPALWHAVAALTCLCMSKQQPQLREDATRHVNRATELLSEMQDGDDIQLQASLAATLSLGLAETWGYEHSSAGTGHIRRAGELLSQIFMNRPGMALESEQQVARIEFLYNLWTYCDCLARLTCNDSFPSYSAPEPIPHWTTLGWTTSNIDPLMGYSTTFFPIMRRVADLINLVRSRTSIRNSPAMISSALELRGQIETWVPSIDLEAVDNPTPIMTDAIQTAEAYRWATLALLYQAVPELPHLTSYGELSQKIMVYLATIPLSSTTVIVHILPLMVAGADAVEDEDRQFVRDRWKAMSSRMVSGVVARCLCITEEVWRRRHEEYPQVLKHVPGRANGFPISAAFKRGADTLTRSGCDEYTVRGRLHWLGVMKDWGWEVMLG